MSEKIQNLSMAQNSGARLSGFDTPPAWITSRSTWAAKLNTKRLGVRQNYLPRSEQPNNGTQMQCRSFSNLDGILVRPRDREIPALFGTRNDSFGIAGMRDQWRMSNVLKVSLQVTIQSLHCSRLAPTANCARTWGQSRNSWPLLAVGKPAISTTGSEASCDIKPAISTAGTAAERKSQRGPLAGAITAKVEVGMLA
jgi:hypothetical protein